MTSSATAAHDFKVAFLAAVQTAVLTVSDAGTVLVSFGHPGYEAFLAYDDAIGLADVRVDQTPGPMSNLHSRNEAIALSVFISCFRAGGADQEQVAAAAAYGYLRAIEHQVRVTDTTVGGTCWECFLTSHESTGETDQALLESGRTIQIEATFTARVRITGA